MGDMADFFLDRALEECGLYDIFAGGGMSQEDAYDYGFIDELGGESFGPAGYATLTHRHRRPRSVTCRFCDTPDLRWYLCEDDDKWWLYDPLTNEKHVCKPKKEDIDAWLPK